MKILRFVALASLAALAACQQGKDAAKSGDKPDPGAEAVATVDGASLTRNTFDFYVKAATGKTSADLSPEQRQEALDSLVRMQLVAAQAQRDGLDKNDKEIAAALELSRLDVLQRGLQAKYLKDKTPSEQELRAEYETQVAQMPRTEYRARHILVPSEAQANAVLTRLKSEKFERVAARESIDSSKERGGDLGWFSPATMVRPFADAVMGMKTGEVSPKPVQTQYGWHVIKLEETRETQPPPFDQVKGQLGQVVMAKKFKAYSDELLKAAKVEKKL